MSLFNLPVVRTKKPESVHPWANTIKNEYSYVIKHAHNSINNDQVHPKSYKKEKKPIPNRCTFTVVGDRVTKEFIYCCQLVTGIHKYRWKYYDTPIIKGVTSAEWPQILSDLKARYGDLAHCLDGHVAVLSDDTLIGGASKLKNQIEMKYIYHLALNYQKESTNQLANFINASGRPCAYLHISIDDKLIGTLIFMLYSDIVPNTCENFLRLCQAKKGGYSGTPVHRIVKDGWIQCGGFSLKSTPMDCENFMVPYDRRGVIGMANAGRHVDCSTQCFVLLQPNEWLNTRFVAFGQLIEGEETLKKIEAVQTLYESPTANVMIVGAGILNMECCDVTINKETKEYLNAHIEDLVSLGQVFYELLLENVFLEIEFRLLQRLELEGEEAVGEEGRKDIRATQRFMRRKDEIETQLAKSQGDPRNERRQISPSSRASRVEDVKHDSDSEDYVYEAEEYAYTQVTPPLSHSVTHQPTKDYFLPLTDVPYPGEVDSNFDLKRYLGGDYCLKADLDPKMPKKLRLDLAQRQEEKLNNISKVMSSYGAQLVKDESFSLLSDEVDSDQEKEIKNYLKIFREKVSFTGKTLSNIAKRNLAVNPIKEKRSREIFADEELRRIRMAAEEVNNRENRTVSISVDRWKMPTRIIRRQTGFVRSHKLTEDNKKASGTPSAQTELNNYSRSVGINAPEESHKAIKRKQTGILKAKRHLVIITHEEVEKEESKPPRPYNQVRPDKSVPPQRSTPHTDEGADKQIRPSTLVRLFEDVAALDNTNPPRLKDFIPMSEIKPKKSMLLSSTEALNYKILHRNENYFDDENTIIKRFSSNNKTIQEIETRHEKLIRTTEFGRMRPTITVSEYQKKYHNEIRNLKAKYNELKSPI